MIQFRVKTIGVWAFLGIQKMQNSKFSSTMVESYPNHKIPFSSNLYILLSINCETGHNSTTDPMKQTSLQATDVLDDLTHFRYTIYRIFSNHARYFLIKFAILWGSQIYYWKMTLDRIYQMSFSVEFTRLNYQLWTNSLHF